MKKTKKRLAMVMQERVIPAAVADGSGTIASRAPPELKADCIARDLHAV